MSWRLFKMYSPDMANEVLKAFERAGYTATESDAMADNASSKWDLPAHGTGGTDSGTQGNYQRVAMEWKTKLIAYATNHPKHPSGEPPKPSGPHQSFEEKRATDKKKEEHKAARADSKHREWHIKNPRLKCQNRGCELNPQ